VEPTSKPSVFLAGAEEFVDMALIVMLLKVRSAEPSITMKAALKNSHFSIAINNTV
jgi:hypothetical protein